VHPPLFTCAQSSPSACVEVGAEQFYCATTLVEGVEVPKKCFISVNIYSSGEFF